MTRPKRKTTRNSGLRNRLSLSVLVTAVCLAALCGSGCKSELQLADHLAPEFTNSIGMKFCLVKPGEFQMGSPPDWPATDGSQPQHTVQITKPYYVAAFEVTQEEFTQIMELSPSHFCDTGPGATHVQGLDTKRFPVDRVTWEEAVEFCERLNDIPEEHRANRKYRLPTEAEWEYACRAGSTTPYSHGDSIGTQQANIQGSPDSDPAAPGRTTEVGSYAPNALGIYDMHGNVWEWCAAGKREYTSRAVTNPAADPSFYSLIRGGAWDYPAEYCRSDFRQEAMSGYVYFGFRVVCEVDSE